MHPIAIIAIGLILLILGIVVGAAWRHDSTLARARKDALDLLRAENEAFIRSESEHKIKLNRIRARLNTVRSSIRITRMEVERARTPDWMTRQVSRTLSHQIADALLDSGVISIMSSVDEESDHTDYEAKVTVLMPERPPVGSLEDLRRRLMADYPDGATDWERAEARVGSSQFKQDAGPSDPDYRPIGTVTDMAYRRRGIGSEEDMRGRAVFVKLQNPDMPSGE